MHHTLRNALTVEARKLLDEVVVLHQHRAVNAGRLRLLVVLDGRAVFGGEFAGIGH
jgi:hypothetical protein